MDRQRVGESAWTYQKYYRKKQLKENRHFKRKLFFLFSPITNKTERWFVRLSNRISSVTKREGPQMDWSHRNYLPFCFCFAIVSNNESIMKTDLRPLNCCCFYMAVIWFWQFVASCHSLYENSVQDKNNTEFTID